MTTSSVTAQKLTNRCPTPKDTGDIYYVPSKELMKKYQEIRKEARIIIKLGMPEIREGEKAAYVFLTEDPSKAEVQQYRDNDTAFIYTLKDFNRKLNNRSQKISPIGETRLLNVEKINNRFVWTVERKLYESGQVEITQDIGLMKESGNLPFAPPKEWKYNFNQ